MSRGGRGGRGGQGGGGSSRLNHGTVPFEIDAALEEKASGMRKDHGLFPVRARALHHVIATFQTGLQLPVHIHSPVLMAEWLPQLHRT